jgi:hypothetical protein
MPHLLEKAPKNTPLKHPTAFFQKKKKVAN